MEQNTQLSEKDIHLLQDTIKKVSSYDFSDYSYNSFYRRIEKILTDEGITFDSLVTNLQKDYNYLDKVVRNITVNTTELFRDPETWYSVRKAIELNFARQKSINIWHAGCSNGLEVYSLMILLSEMNLLEKATIYASDINQTVLNTAMSGKYKYHEINEYIENFDKALNQNEDMKKYYPSVDIKNYMEINKFKDFVRMKDFLIEKPLFIKHDLVSCKNIFAQNFDIILCRNVLIYFNHNLQNKVLSFFYDNLTSKGCLIIGRHEGIIGPIASNFSKQGTIYFRRNSY
ncbi:MAG: hypothetical protein II937_01635 [Bacteroidales bacterium]|nr:hypothetical protein [Bacteroidales bacterium]